MARDRTLSEEGVKMFLGGIVSNPSKRGLRRFLFACFSSDYDDRLKDVVIACRESTKALYAKLWSGDRLNLNAGISHATKLMLTSDHQEIKMHHIRNNFKFFLDVCERSFNTDDHQTAMLMYIALNHSALTRLKFKRPKKTSTIFKALDERYGPSNVGYSKHVEEILHSTTLEFLPSLIAVDIFRGKYSNYSSYSQVSDMVDSLNEVMNMTALLYLREKSMIGLYGEDVATNSMLFDLSEKIQPSEKKWNYHINNRIVNVTNIYDTKYK